MISSNQIRKLANLSSNHPISSLYLRLWPDARIHRTRAKNMIREKGETLGNLSKGERHRVEGDLDRMQEFVTRLRKSPHKGLAVFSCSADKVWEVFSLPQPVRDHLVLDFSPYVRPLLRALEEYRRVCTLLIDRSRARIFEIFMGEIQEQSEIFDDVPSKVREAGWYGLNERRIERHVENHLQTHLKKVADRTLDYFRREGFDWLLLGGHVEMLPELESMLHSYLRTTLKKTFMIDLKARPKQVLDKTLELMLEIKNEEDQSRVTRLRESLAGRGLGVTGIEETLSSLYEGSVHSLLVEEGFSREGAVCLNCEFMGLVAGSCPMCGETLTPVPDVVEEAIAKTIDENGEVVHVAAGIGLSELGGIGALLRYAPVMEKREAMPETVS